MPKIIGQNKFYLPSCHSTNAEANRLLAENDSLPEGTVVYTADQTAGKGQRGSHWESAPGLNLTLSLVLRPAFLAAPQTFDLSKAMALAVYDLLSRHTDDGLKLKWPNDLYCHGRKLGGILIENQWQGGILRTAVVGIGLNINQMDFMVENATSLRLETRQPLPYDLGGLLGELCHCLQHRYEELRQGHTASQHADYLQRLYRLGQWHPYRAGAKVFMGRLTGVSDRGLLQLETDTGLQEFEVKEVAFV